MRCFVNGMNLAIVFFLISILACSELMAQQGGVSDPFRPSMPRTNFRNLPNPPTTQVRSIPKPKINIPNRIQQQMQTNTAQNGYTSRRTRIRGLGKLVGLVIFLVVGGILGLIKLLTGGSDHSTKRPTSSHTAPPSTYSPSSDGRRHGFGKDNQSGMFDR